MDVDGRMEPPVGPEADEDDDDGGHDEGAFAPRGHAVGERDLHVHVRRLIRFVNGSLARVLLP